MFGARVLDAIQADACRRYPEESCGAVTPSGYLSLANLAADPLVQFDCSAACNELMIAGQLLAVVHSHPDGPDGPSGQDIASQRGMALPWGLVVTDGQVAGQPYFWGDGVPTPPLLGREFRHGPSGTDGRGDCGALIRDWYLQERGILIPDFARNDHWWQQGQDLYAEHFAEAGFVAADRDQPEIGDVALIQFRSVVANHAGIYVGPGLLLHHLEGRLSRHEPIIGWAKHVRIWLRHHV